MSKQGDWNKLLFKDILDKEKMSSSGFDIQPLTSTRFGLGEGPFWEPKSKKLYIVDAFVGNFVQIDTDTRVENIHNFSPDIVTFIIPNASDDDLFIVSKNNHVSRLKWSTKDLTSLMSVEDNQGTRFNDAKCDSRGRLWAGTMASSDWVPPGKGSLYKITPSTADRISIQKEFSPVILSNGIAWTNDDTKMFFVDSTKKVIYKFDYDIETGNATNSSIFMDCAVTPEAAGVPDGMSMDADGKLWVAFFGGARILRIDPETGKVLSIVDMPCERVTSLTFGGPNHQIIYATSARCDDFNTSFTDVTGEAVGGAVFQISSTKENIRGNESKRFNDRA